MEEEKTYTVSEFNNLVDSYLSKIGRITIEGEISQIEIRADRWLFLIIKDENSILKVFSSTDKILNFQVLKEGMSVQVYGVPGLYKALGRFEVKAIKILPRGEGALKEAFEILKKKLEEDGLFSIDRKRPLPTIPEKIGLITSKEGKAYSDIVKTLNERTKGLEFIFYPVSVQGVASILAIQKAIAWFNAYEKNLDLLILARGGGSLEDLQSFNSEEVCRSIFSSKIPVVCGVGHEKDITLADLVADVRASTPTNAAEIVARLREEALRKTVDHVHSIEVLFTERLREGYRRVDYNITMLNNYFRDKLNEISFLIKRFGMAFDKFARQLDEFNEIINRSINTMKNTLVNLMSTTKLKVEYYERLLTSFNPKNVLRRGYSITRDSNGKVIKIAKDLQIRSKIDTKVFSGSIKAVVLKIS